MIMHMCVHRDFEIIPNNPFTRTAHIQIPNSIRIDEMHKEFKTARRDYRETLPSQDNLLDIVHQ